MMKRRGFLKGLFGAALVPIVGKGDGVELTCIPHPQLNEHTLEEVCRQLRDAEVTTSTPRGFGLSPLKREGGQVTFDAWPPPCDCDDGPHGTACSNRNVLRRERLG